MAALLLPLLPRESEAGMDETLRRMVDKLTDARKKLEDDINQAMQRETVTAELLGRVEALKRRLGTHDETPNESAPPGGIG